jgi:hypothetical protein
MNKKFVFLILFLVVLVIGFLVYVNFFTDSCKKISDSDKRNNCYQKTAKENKDLSICEKITDTTINSCLWNVAELKNDTSLCKKISDSEDRDWCYNLIAQDNKDTEICNMINSTISRDKCNKCLRGEDLPESCYGG